MHFHKTFATTHKQSNSTDITVGIVLVLRTVLPTQNDTTSIYVYMTDEIYKKSSVSAVMNKPTVSTLQLQHVQMMHRINITKIQEERQYVDLALSSPSKCPDTLSRILRGRLLL